MNHMKSMLRSRLVHLKDNNAWLRLLWLQALARRARRERQELTDVQCINQLYRRYVDRDPDLENPTTFSEKMQWLKLNYRNPLMPVVGDKYAVRAYLEQQGYAHLLNELIAVYERAEDFNPKALPQQFVLKATHASGWNLIVKNRDKVNWWIWRKHIHYWLTHDIAWNGREWHYGEMTPRVVCERYLQDDSGGLMDYKFYCFNGEPHFLQVNVGRGELGSTQNYYTLDWQLLPFGKSQPHNPDAQVQRPAHFDEMVEAARALSKPFPYVRMDFYEANGRVYFGEFTFFPCSGMPDFIPIEWDARVGQLLHLPKP